MKNKLLYFSIALLLLALFLGALFNRKPKTVALPLVEEEEEETGLSPMPSLQLSGNRAITVTKAPSRVAKVIPQPPPPPPEKEVKEEPKEEEEPPRGESVIESYPPPGGGDSGSDNGSSGGSRRASKEVNTKGILLF
jgi:hypothetical protein